MRVAPAYIFPLEIWGLILEKVSLGDLYSLAQVHSSLTKICSRAYKQVCARLDEIGYTQEDVTCLINHTDGYWHINRSCVIRFREDLTCRALVLQGKTRGIVVTINGNNHKLCSSPNFAPTDKALLDVDGIDGLNVYDLNVIAMNNNDYIVYINDSSDVTISNTLCMREAQSRHEQRRVIPKSLQARYPLGIPRPPRKNYEHEMEKRKRQAQRLERKRR